MSQQQTATQAKEVVLRSYVPKDTPENVYRALRGYHYVLVGMFLFWVVVRVLCVVGTQFFKVSETAVALMPVEIRSGTLGALICVLYAAFNLTTAFGLLVKEPWGWWVGLVGLCWGITQSIADASIAVAYSQSAFVTTMHALIAIGLCLWLSWLIRIHLSPGMKVKFDVQTKSSAALGAAMAGGFVLGIVFLAIVWKLLPASVSAV
jgi:hypothetical protein